MTQTKRPEIHLVGLALREKTSNVNGQSAIDCGNHWQAFEKANIAAQISGRLGDEIFAVYHDYEGDHTKPYAYFIGCPVSPATELNTGLDRLIIPESDYLQILAKGKMPDCVADSWLQIWSSDIQRAYKYDFEVYDHRSRDWQNAEVDIFLS